MPTQQNCLSVTLLSSTPNWDIEKRQQHHQHHHHHQMVTRKIAARDALFQIQCPRTCLNLPVDLCRVSRTECYSGLLEMLGIACDKLWCVFRREHRTDYEWSVSLLLPRNEVKRWPTSILNRQLRCRSKPFERTPAAPSKCNVLVILQWSGNSVEGFMACTRQLWRIGIALLLSLSHSQTIPNGLGWLGHREVAGRP